MSSGPEHNVMQFLTAAESSELAAIKQDPAVIGYTLLSMDGSEIETSGAFQETSAAIFANMFDIADRMGEEFGADDVCPTLFVEGPDLEIAGITMSSARAVLIKQKPPRVTGDLRNVR